MSKEIILLDENNIKNKIYTIRSMQVILDRDLARLYGVPTKRLNEQVKRNKKRFPERYMFKLTMDENNELVAKCDRLDTSKHSSTLPYVFTEHGVAMLSGILRSKRAIQVNIQIMRAFIQLKRMLLTNADLRRKIEGMERKYDNASSIMKCNT